MESRFSDLSQWIIGQLGRVYISKNVYVRLNLGLDRDTRIDNVFLKRVVGTVPVGEVHAVFLPSSVSKALLT